MSDANSFDEKLFEQRLKDFKPQPLFTPIKPNDEPSETLMVPEDANTIDLAKVNYLNFLNNSEIKKAAEDVIRVYGVGTCGPRIFLGTTDVHMEAEEHFAKFFHMEESLFYAYGIVAISSSISAYCRQNDIIFVDECTNIHIQQGCTAARSKIVKFAHNNPDDFKKQISKLSNKEKKKSRKFLVIEAISWNTGKLCPLPEFVTVAEEFKVRIFLEESHSFGVLGATGRGLTEYYNIDPSRVDIVFGTLHGAIGSDGGFCAAPSWYTLDIQRMHGAGFVFSASISTYLAKVVSKGLELLGDKPQKLVVLAKKIHKFLEEECKFNVLSHPEAPFKLISIEPKRKEKMVHQYCKDKGVWFIHNENGLVINLNVTLLEDQEKLERIYQVFKEASDLIII